MAATIFLIFLGCICVGTVLWTIHEDYGLPYTKRRKHLKCLERIWELEWEMNIAKTRSWSVSKRWDNKWVARGPHPFVRDFTYQEICDDWQTAQHYADTRATLCAQDVPDRL